MVAGKITVVQMLPELESGGVERGTLEISKYLAAQGHCSLVISRGGRLVTALEEDGSRHIAWSGIGAKSPLTLGYILPLRRLLLERQVDILHLRSRVPAWVGYLAWRSLPARQRPRLVTTFHGFYSVNSYSAVMARGEKVIAVSKSIRDHIQQHYKVADNRLALIYRGIDTGVFAPASVPADNIVSLLRQWQIGRRNGPVIMLPGRITRLKGHAVFLKALAKIRELDWQAIIVGDLADNPKLAAELQGEVQALGIRDKVYFVGHCRDMPAAYAIADLVVSATTGTPESFGRIVVEALAMGRAVIASGHGGSLETVKPGETGWLVAPGDVDELAGALREALTDSERRIRFGIAGGRWVARNFSLEQMCAKTLAVYTQLLNSPPGYS